MPRVDVLFEPISIGPIRIKNRLVMPPMVMCYAGVRGEVSEQVLAHFERVARGGIGLVIVEASYVHPLGKVLEGQIAIDSDDLVPGLSRVVDVVKSFGAAIAIQLFHGGIQAKVPEPVGPSAIARKLVPPPKTPRELTTREVEELVEAFANAALRAKQAGFDMVEVHGTHGYLVAEFLSPLTNRRTDKYGADRALFAIEIVERIKEKCGKSYPVIFRLIADEFEPGGITVDYAKQIAKRLEEVGVDAFDITAGTYDSLDHIIPPIYYDTPGYFAKYAREIKKVVSVPVITGGMISTPEDVAKLIEEGYADAVFVGRQLLADPEWPRKVREGRIEEIRPCIACNVCLERIFLGRALTCAVNPLKGLESRYLSEEAIPKAVYRKRVLIVGTGPAGLECARIAKIRGHDVVVIDREKEIGGALRVASRPEFKKRLERLIRWYEVQVKKLGIELRLGTEFSTDVVKEVNPDIVVIATGSRPLIPKIPGVENAVIADDVLLGRVDVGKSVVVVGGGLVGCETALFLAKQGREVTIVEMLSDIAIGEPFVNRVAIKKLLRASGVRVLTKRFVSEIRKGEVEILDEVGRREVLKADTIVLAVGREPNIPREVVEEVRKMGKELYVIGDAKEVRKIVDAIREGFYTALNI